MPFKQKERKRIYQKEYMQRPETKEGRAKNRAIYYTKKPWARTIRNVRRRCNCKGHWYHDQGIKCLLTLKDVEFLWHRDKASFMQNPSIDRINGGHYTFENCRYIELVDNKSRDKWRENSS